MNDQEFLGLLESLLKRKSPSTMNTCRHREN